MKKLNRVDFQYKTKLEIAKDYAIAIKTTLKDAQILCNFMFNELTNSLLNRDGAEIRGFGNFTKRLQPNRISRNPSNGTEINLEPRHTVHFKAGYKLREDLIDKVRV